MQFIGVLVCPAESVLRAVRLITTVTVSRLADFRTADCLIDSPGKNHSLRHPGQSASRYRTRMCRCRSSRAISGDIQTFAECDRTRCAFPRGEAFQTR